MGSRDTRLPYGDQFPGLALVFHKSKDQLSGLTPTELHLELTNKENYSLSEVSELSVYNIAKFSRKWGPSGLWGGDTEFQIDVTECEDLVYLLSAEVDDLVDTMASQHAAVAASKTPPAPDARAQKRGWRPLNLNSVKLLRCKLLATWTMFG